MKRDIFQAIADPTRRLIITMLAVQAMTPNALAEHFESSRQAVSKHIQFLSECDVVKSKHIGREIYYYVNAKKLKEADRWLEGLRMLWDNRFHNLDNILNDLKTKKS